MNSWRRGSSCGRRRTRRCRGPQRLLTPALLATLRTQKEQIIDQLHSGVEVLPLAYGQWVFWFEHQVSATSAAFNLSLALRIHGAVDVMPWRRLADVGESSPMLRTDLCRRSGRCNTSISTSRWRSRPVDVTGQSWDEISRSLKERHAAVRLQRPGFLAWRSSNVGRRCRPALFGPPHRLRRSFALDHADELPKLYQIARHGEGEAPAPAPARQGSDYATCSVRCSHAKVR
ncbi:MAG: hypothetical protein R2851_09005 [Caldilineaceae bacterium]